MRGVRPYHDRRTEVGLVFAQVHDQVDRSGRKETLLRVRNREALVQPEHLDEIRERWAGEVVEEPHSVSRDDSKALEPGGASTRRRLPHRLVDDNMRESSSALSRLTSSRMRRRTFLKESAIAAAGIAAAGAVRVAAAEPLEAQRQNGGSVLVDPK